MPLCRLCRMESILICSCAESVDWNWPPWFAIVSTLWNDIDPDMLKCHLCPMKSTLLCSCGDFVEWYWPWLAHVSTLSTVIDTELPICRLFRLKLSLICSIVDFVDSDWPWWAYGSTLSTKIDPDPLMFHLYWLWLLSRLALESILLIVNESFWLMCRLFRLKSTLIYSCLDSVD